VERNTEITQKRQYAGLSLYSDFATIQTQAQVIPTTLRREPFIWDARQPDRKISEPCGSPNPDSYRGCTPETFDGRKIAKVTACPKLILW